MIPLALVALVMLAFVVEKPLSTRVDREVVEADSDEPDATTGQLAVATATTGAGPSYDPAAAPSSATTAPASVAQAGTGATSSTSDATPTETRAVANHRAGRSRRRRSAPRHRA